MHQTNGLWIENFVTQSMDRYFAHIATLLAEPGQSRHAVCKVFAAKPAAEKEIAVGKFFGLAEIVPGNAASNDLITELIERIKDEVYGPPEIRLPHPLAAPPSPDLEGNLSAALQRANAWIASAMEGDRLSLDLARTSLLVGLIRAPQLSIATLNRMYGFLFHSRPNREYQVVAVVEPNLEAAPNPLRVFTQTVAGHMGPHDYLFFCTESLLDYLSLHTIQTAVTQNAGGDAMRRLKLFIARARPKTAVAALTINLVRQHQSVPITGRLKASDIATAAAKDSMRRLDQTQRKTLNLLSPRLLPNTKRWLVACWRARLQTAGRVFAFRRRGRSKKPARSASPAVTPSTAASPPSPTLSAVIRRTLAGISRALQTFRRHPLARWTKHAIAPRLQTAWRAFRRRPRPQQLMIIGSALVVILLGYNVIAISGSRSVAARKKAFTTVLQQAKNLRDAAQAALIYRDEGEARQKLNEALRMLSTLPADYAQDPEIVRSVREFNDELNKLRHEIAITEPLQLGNFSNLDESAKTPPLLVRLQSILYTQNAKTKALLTLNLGNRTIGAMQPQNPLRATLTAGAQTDKNALLLDNENRLYQLDAPDILRPVSLTLASGNLAALAHFRNRLYLLDAARGTIWRADGTSDGFASPRDWIADDTVDLTPAVDLAVDGDVWVALANGAILKLRQGKRTDFPLQTIDPPLSGPTKIKTTESSPNLYLLDPPTKRVVVVSKTGKLVAQYASGFFDQLRDFVVDEANKILYILNGTIIYGVPMEP